MFKMTKQVDVKQITDIQLSDLEANALPKLN